MTDMSGLWMGSYSYPDDLEPTTFFWARIDEDGVSFTGRTEEYDMTLGSIGASVNGSCSGSQVGFTKVYDSTAYSGFDPPVHYQGTISSDSETVTGVWRLQGLTGSFQMRRKPRAQASAPRRARVSKLEPV